MVSGGGDPATGTAVRVTSKSDLGEQKASGRGGRWQQDLAKGISLLHQTVRVQACTAGGCVLSVSTSPCYDQLREGDWSSFLGLKVGGESDLPGLTWEGSGHRRPLAE